MGDMFITTESTDKDMTLGDAIEELERRNVGSKKFWDAVEYAKVILQTLNGEI